MGSTIFPFHSNHTTNQPNSTKTHLFVITSGVVVLMTSAISASLHVVMAGAVIEYSKNSESVIQNSFDILYLNDKMIVMLSIKAGFFLCKTIVI